VLGLLLLSALPAGRAAEMDWRALPGAGQARVDGGRLLLKLPGGAETAGLRSTRIPVTPNARMNLAFAYTSENLSAGVFDHNSARRRRTVRLVASLRWLDEHGEDVDAKRAGLGFPPLAMRWQFHADSAAPRRVADNVSGPGEARAVEISFRLETAAQAGDKDRVTVVKAAIGDVALRAGQITPEGLETADSGPADAGPLSTPPPEYAFVANLVPNPTFNEGTEGPTGWRIEGDNAHGAAVWQDGGAFSGRRCLKVYDRGPYVRSWGENSPSVYVPGSSPGDNYAYARQEVSARWVSEPSPAQAGAVYQAMAFLWYANRHFIDRGAVNPVRIQFLDAAGKVLPYNHVWQDWLPNELPFFQEGWVRVLGGPVVAPANAVSVRVAVVMFSAFFGGPSPGYDNRGFVLVDNIALYRVRSERQRREGVRPLDPEEAFWDTAQARGLPFVPTSAAHRPDTLGVESDTGYPGGILFAPANPRSKPLNLRLQNWIGDPRTIEVRCEIEDWLGQPIRKNTVSTTLPPYGSGTAAIAYPDDIPLGAYTIRYVIREAGVDQDQDFTRFAVLAKRETTPEERGRDDYPFSLWAPFFAGSKGRPEEALMGQMFDAVGMGKTTYGTGGLDIDRVIGITDPAARRRAVEGQIAQARATIATWRRYGVTPMGYMHAKATKEQHPILAEVVTQVVTALKDDIRHWRWGNEFVHGEARELDRATNADGSHYLYWGHPGTVRQYWETYVVAYQAAKAADPKCMFGPNVAYDATGTVLRLFFQVRRPNELDMFGINTYVNAESIWPSSVAELRKAGIPDLPLFSSEFHARTEAANKGPTRLEAERDAVRRMVTYWAEVLTKYPTFFHLEQERMKWNFHNNQNHLHLNRMRPQLVAYAAMTDILGAGRFVERLELPGAVIHVRERSLRPGLVGVMWSTGPEAVVKLKVGNESLVLADVMGNRRRLATPGGVATIPLTPMPQYLLGASVVRPAP
jgi:hypothetical protein